MRRVLIIGLAVALSSVANAGTKSSAWITDVEGDQANILRSLMSSTDNGQGGEENGQDETKGQEDKGKQDDEPKQDSGDKGKGWDEKKFMRVDCRYHNDEKIKGINHCYASAIYQPTKHGYKYVHLGIGCDAQTIYNDRGYVQSEQVGERISPPTAAFPAVELFPQGALRSTGTYESVLDIRAGRLNGTCYVHRLKADGDYHGHDSDKDHGQDQDQDQDQDQNDRGDKDHGQDA